MLTRDEVVARYLAATGRVAHRRCVAVLRGLRAVPAGGHHRADPRAGRRERVAQPRPPVVLARRARPAPPVSAPDPRGGPLMGASCSSATGRRRSAPTTTTCCPRRTPPGRHRRRAAGALPDVHRRSCTGAMVRQRDTAAPLAARCGVEVAEEDARLDEYDHLELVQQVLDDPCRAAGRGPHEDPSPRVPGGARARAWHGGSRATRGRSRRATTASVHGSARRSPSWPRPVRHRGGGDLRRGHRGGLRRCARARPARGGRASTP